MQQCLRKPNVSPTFLSDKYGIPRSTVVSWRSLKPTTEDPKTNKKNKHKNDHKENPKFPNSKIKTTTEQKSKEVKKQEPDESLSKSGSLSTLKIYEEIFEGRRVQTRSESAKLSSQNTNPTEKNIYTEKKKPPAGKNVLTQKHNQRVYNNSRYSAGYIRKTVRLVQKLGAQKAARRQRVCMATIDRWVDQYKDDNKIGYTSSPSDSPMSQSEAEILPKKRPATKSSITCRSKKTLDNNREISSHLMAKREGDKRKNVLQNNEKKIVPYVKADENGGLINKIDVERKNPEIIENAEGKTQGKQVIHVRVGNGNALVTHKEMTCLFLLNQQFDVKFDVLWCADE